MSLKINKKSNRLSRRHHCRKNAILAFIAFVLFAGLCLVILEKLNITDFVKLPIIDSPIYTDTTNLNNNEVKVNNGATTQEQIEAGKQIKSNSENTNSSIISASISSLTIDSDYVHIKSSISGAVSNSGTCKLSLTDVNTDIVVSKSANTYALPSSSTCMGFDISRTELSNGDWRASLTVSIGDESTSVSQNFTVK